MNLLDELHHAFSTGKSFEQIVNRKLPDEINTAEHALARIAHHMTREFAAYFDYRRAIEPFNLGSAPNMDGFLKIQKRFQDDPQALLKAALIMEKELKPEYSRGRDFELQMLPTLDFYALSGLHTASDFWRSFESGDWQETSEVVLERIFFFHMRIVEYQHLLKGKFTEESVPKSAAKKAAARKHQKHAERVAPIRKLAEEEGQAIHAEVRQGKRAEMTREHAVKAIISRLSPIIETLLRDGELENISTTDLTPRRVRDWLKEAGLFPTPAEKKQLNA